MLKQIYTKQFKKDLARSIKRGKDPSKIGKIIEILAENKELSPRYKDHALIGDYKGRRDCHIEPDWLLIYKKEDNSIIFERTGTHSDLFN